MNGNRSTFNFRLNQRGQIALFIALVFQVLFLFFAMVINVGLLVHHKVNLQNSVDLAAYYGAAKQAENLNAIGHMNYQIRQSWKLLAWRYRMLGSAGEDDTGKNGGNAYNRTSRQISPDTDVMETANANIKNFQQAPPFCIIYQPFKEIQGAQNMCKRASGMQGITLFGVPGVISISPGDRSLAATVRAFTLQMLQLTVNDCRNVGSVNYSMLGRFVGAFVVDQADRLAVINAMAGQMSSSESDFMDLDGESVATGVQKTFQKNLTSANASSAKMEFFNSLASGSCAQTVSGKGPPKWLSPINIMPGFNYMDAHCPASIKDPIKQIQPFPQVFDSAHLPEQLTAGAVDPILKDFIEKVKQLIGYQPGPFHEYNMTVGVEKDPWCMAYVGVKATSAPSVPFSPFGAVTLKARGFFKPFGGRIGPWYGKTWDATQDKSTYNPSDMSSKSDPNFPPRVVSSSTASAPNPTEAATRAANYSRFIGDQYGLKTYMMLGNYSKAFYDLDSPPLPGDFDPTIYAGSKSPTFKDWYHLPFNYVDTKDMLAWKSADFSDDKKDGVPRMRDLEIAAIAPDTFDATYYSIEPDFYNTYYKRMEKGIVPKLGSGFKDRFRPDLGYHEGYKVGKTDLSSFGVKDQVAWVNRLNPTVPVKDKFTFIINEWFHVLTSWIPVDIYDYSIGKDRFATCSTPAQAGKPTPGNCIYGGSAGYSVKMVSSDYLTSTMTDIGGEGTSGNIKNPPPADFLK